MSEVILEELKAQLKEIMLSGRYVMPTERAEAVFSFIWGMDKSDVLRFPLLCYFLENYNEKKLGQTQEWSATVGVTLERSAEIFKERASYLFQRNADFLNNHTPVEEVAKWLMEEIDQAPTRDHKIVILTWAMRAGLTPYKFLKGSVDVSEEEWDKLLEECEEEIELIEDIFASGKFHKRTNEGSFFVDLLQGKDPKTQAFLMYIIIKCAREKAGNFGIIFGGPFPGMPPSSGGSSFEPPPD